MNDAMNEARALLAPMLRERLIASGDDGFKEAAAVVFEGEGRMPSLVARVREVDEIRAVVRAAARTGVPFAVRGSGHGYARPGSVPDGLVLDLRLMGGTEIDPARRIGVAHAGTTAGEYTHAAAEYGLATGFGDTLTVGIPGLALGGGIGFLSRRDGLTLDNVLSADVVLADGSTVQASETRSPDLFWALRGGGGNFGVVTRMELRLSEARVVTGGLLAFEPDPRTFAALLTAASTAPAELSIMVNAMKSPPAPFLPAERHGKAIIMAIVCHSGNPEHADAVLAPLRSAGKLVADLVRQQAYPQLFGLAPEQNGARVAQRTGFLDGLDEGVSAAALAAVETAPTPVAVVNLRPMGGAISRVPTGATAFAHRDRAIMATVGMVDRDAERFGAGTAWVEELASSAGIGGAAYVKFLDTTGPDSTAAAYPEATLGRLREVKRVFDPQNLFRSNQNIPPA